MKTYSLIMACILALLYIFEVITFELAMLLMVQLIICILVTNKPNNTKDDKGRT